MSRKQRIAPGIVVRQNSLLLLQDAIIEEKQKKTIYCYRKKEVY